MKKRILCLMLVIVLLLGVLPASALAATDPASVKLYIEKDVKIGMNGRSNITVTASVGTIYLPGTADAAKCFLCWDADDVQVNGQDSGKVAIPAPGSSDTYLITSGGKTVSIVLRTLQGSEGISGLFFTIDESLGTISAMNRDRLKEATCYGIANLDGEDMPMSIKGRGNSTWTNFDKKPYNFTTYTDSTYTQKAKHKLIGDISTNKWSILANAKDSTLLRNRLALELADKLGIGLQTRFVDVWINGEYNGSYLMTPKNDYQSPKAGYMIEIDNLNDPVDPQFTVRGFDGSRAPTFTVKDNNAGVSTEEIKSYVQKAATAILDTTSSEYLKYIDVDSWAKMYLLNEFYKTTDVVSGSIFFTRAGLADSDKLVAGPVWDFDVALGRAWAKSVTTVEDEAQVSGGKWYIDNILTKAWYRALGAHKEIMARVYELYNEYKEYFDAVPAYVAEQDAFVKASADMNFDLWDVNRDQDHNPFTCTRQVTYGAEPYAVTYIAASTRDHYVTNLMTYVTARAKFLSDRLTVASPEGTISGNSTVQPGQTMTLRAEVTAGENVTCQWQSSTDGITWKDIPGATAMEYSVEASAELNSVRFRCVARSNGPLIDDVKNVARVNAGAIGVLGPVELSLDAGEHTHSYTAAVTAPTCAGDGFTTYTCSVCGKSYQSDRIPALGHAFADGRCTRCGLTAYTLTFDCDEHCHVISYKTHEYEGPEENARFAYARSADTGEIDVSGEGQVNFKVLVDEGYVVDMVSSKSANFKNIKHPADTGVDNGYRVTKLVGDVVLSITTVKKECSHEFVVKETAPTCTEAGDTTYTCKKCGYSYKDAVRPAFGHDYTAVQNAPTCTEAGYTTYTCEICGDSYIEPLADSALTVETEVKVPSGLTSKRSSMTYGKVYNLTYHSTVAGRDKKVNVQVPADYSESKTYPVLYLLHGVMGSENDMVSHGTTIQNMVADGLAEEMIIVCPNMFSGKSASPSGINQASMEGYDKFSDEIVTDLMPFIRENFSVREGKANTALAGFSLGGRETLSISLFHPEVFGYICAISSAPGVIAGKDMFMTHPGQFTEEEVRYPEGQAPFIMMTSGDKDSVVGTFPQEYDALYTKNGIDHSWWVIPGADHGGATASGIYNFAKYVFKTASASGPLGHDYHAQITEPTCTEAGCTVYTCARCGDSYRGNETAALGHDWDEGEIIMEPGVSTQGIKLYTCKRCGEIREEKIPVKPHVHDFEAYVTAPTCTGAGYTVYLCDCGETYTADEVPALGHDYQDAVTAPTCTEAGRTVYTCKRCGDSYTEARPAFGHDYTAVHTPSTCELEGFTVYTCTRCGDSYVGDKTSALGHDYDNGRCTRCGADEPIVHSCPSAGFSDVPEKGNWAHEGIDYCISRDYMNGVGGDVFNPQGNVTRAQLVTILYRVEREPEVEFKATFSDVDDGLWYSDAIEWAAAGGIVNGVGEGRFNPMGAITREQIAAIFYRYAGAEQPAGGLSAFPDAEDAHSYAIDPLVWAVQEGILTGVKTGEITYLRPLLNATRAQIASIILRYQKGSYHCS